MTFQNVSVTPLPIKQNTDNSNLAGRTKSHSIDKAPSTEIDALSAAMLIQSLKEASSEPSQEPNQEPSPTSTSSSITPPPPPPQSSPPKSPSAANNRTKSFEESSEVESFVMVDNVNPIHALQAKAKPPPPSAADEDTPSEQNDPSQQNNTNRKLGRAGRGAGRKPPPPKPGATDETSPSTTTSPDENVEEVPEESPKQGQEKRRSVNMKRVAGSRAHSIRQSVTESAVIVEGINENDQNVVEAATATQESETIMPPPPASSPPSSPVASKPEIVIKPVVIDVPVIQLTPAEMTEPKTEQTDNRMSTMSMDSNEDGLNPDTSPTSSGKKSNLKLRDRENSTASGRASLRVSFAEEAEDSAGGRKKVHSFEVEEPNSDKERLLGEKKKGCLDSCAIS